MVKHRPPGTHNAGVKSKVISQILDKVWDANPDVGDLPGLDKLSLTELTALNEAMNVYRARGAA